MTRRFLAFSRERISNPSHIIHSTTHMYKRHILGIDVSKEKLSFFDTKDESFFEIPNSEKALRETLTEKQKEKQWNKETLSVGLESTGDYSFCPMRFFVQSGFRVVLLNPLVTRKYTRATIRNKKTDRADSETICEMIDRGEGREVSEKDLDTAKKSILRVERKIAAITSTLKRLQKSLEKKKENALSVDPALKEVRRLIRETEKSAERILSNALEGEQTRQEEIIDSHPGFGEKLSAIVSAEAGDISRFGTSKQFVAYAGFDPRIIQSGQKDVRGKMTKRGNPILRHALFLAAVVASRYDDELKRFYNKKRSEGKHYTHAICAVSRKLCGRLYALVTQDRLYEVRSLEEVEAV
jgi:transposase